MLTIKSIKLYIFLVLKRQISASRFFDLLRSYTRVFSESALSFSASLHVLHPNNQKQITLTFCFKTNFKLSFCILSLHIIYDWITMIMGRSKH